MGSLFKITLAKKQQLGLETVCLLTSKTNFLAVTSWQYLYHMKDLKPNAGQEIQKISRSILVCDPWLVFFELSELLHLSFSG